MSHFMIFKKVSATLSLERFSKFLKVVKLRLMIRKPAMPHLSFLKYHWSSGQVLDNRFFGVGTRHFDLESEEGITTIELGTGT